jgi:hypothetical protein
MVVIRRSFVMHNITIEREDEDLRVTSGDARDEGV